ncbi:MAG: amidohydrolase family protein [Candidatus Krumholzibacteriota bacterium]
MIISGGSIITDQGPTRADIHFEGARITAVTPPGEPAGEETVVDAGGLLVLPGAVDAHTHFGMPLGQGISSLGWRESSEAALLGGTTTIIDFANPAVGEPLPQAVAKWRGMADGDILCDYGLHTTVTDVSPDRLAEIPGLVENGLATFKGFLAYKGRLMLAADDMKRLMEAVCKSGAMLLVHAEDGEMNAAAEETLLNTGRTGPNWHPFAHPDESEEKAVADILDMAAETGCPLTIVHMSLARSLVLLKKARKKRNNTITLLGEVCLHHLFADSGLYKAGHGAALASICSPPLRAAGNGDDLLAGLVAGDLDFLSTDHCEFSLAVKSAAAGGGFPRVPNGCGGVGERLAVTYSLAVKSGKMSPARWIEVCCRRPAELMGLKDRKGQLKPGFDADIVLFDPAAEYRWEPLGASDRAGSLWAGLPVSGRVRDVWLRGRQVVSQGVLTLDQPGGQFLPRHL